MKSITNKINESNTNANLQKVDSENWNTLDVIICVGLGENIHFFTGKSWTSDYRLAKVMKGSDADITINQKLNSNKGNNGYVFDIPANPLLWQSAIMLARKNSDTLYVEFLSKLAKDFHIIK